MFIYSFWSIYIVKRYQRVYFSLTFYTLYPFCILFYADEFPVYIFLTFPGKFLSQKIILENLCRTTLTFGKYNNNTIYHILKTYSLAT